MPIYTKKGDSGETGLFGSRERISKAQQIFDVLGTIDEANSHLGLAGAYLEDKIIRNKIHQVQRNLFNLGANLAGASLPFSSRVIEKYEKEIDAWLKVIPQRNNFILPGGSLPAAELFVARAVVRRLERGLAALNQTQKIKPVLLKFTNRLSDYLYVLARYLNYLDEKEETIWKK